MAPKAAAAKSAKSRKAAPKAAGKKASKAAGKKPATGGETPYHHGDLRRALLDAALALVEKEGPQGLTLRAAARMAGVSQAAPYRHFKDKEALLAAVAEEGFHALAKKMEAALASAGNDPVARFQATGIAYVEFAAENPSHFRVMFGAEIGDKEAYGSLREAGRATYAMQLEAIEACRKAGLVPMANMEVLSLAAWSLVHGLSSLIVDERLHHMGYGRKDAGKVARLVTQTLFEGIVPPKKR